jgi:predicted phosphodiesterase
MKIAVASDIHLEFGDILLENTEAADVLVLSGDIMVAEEFRTPGHWRAQRQLTFMENCSERFPNVVYVMGNHEHYNGNFTDTHQLLIDAFKHLPNVHVLDKQTVDILGVTFIGGTLWTDMNGGQPETIYHIRSMMNDFKVITHGTKMVNYKTEQFPLNEDGTVNYRGTPTAKFNKRPASFSPEDAIEEHQAMITFINTTLTGLPADAQVVVCGHHSPSKRSTHPRYQHDTLMNGGYSSDLDQYIEKNPRIVLWTHGHTHEPFDYQVGQTRILCNPRGYINYEASAADFKLKFIDI